MSAPVALFKKGPKRPITSRRRSPSPSASSSASILDPAKAGESSVVRPTKKSIINPLVQGSKRRRDFTSDDADADGAGGLEDLDYAATDTLTFKGDQYATRGNDHDTDVYGAITHTSEKKRLRLNEDGDLLDGAQAVDDGQYRGLNNYLPTINKTREVLDKKMKSGPIRATASVRTITLVDYQPDVCKDYKETGFCGYGDSCKFMHDRGDYLAGWQLDKLDPDGGAQAVPEEDDEEEVPFACLICRKEFTEPVVTKCGHYFCMSCAVARFIKSPKCYACGAATGGHFAKAEKILAKMEEKNRRKREEKGLEPVDGGGIEFGGGASDEDEEGRDGDGDDAGAGEQEGGGEVERSDDEE